jgi:hypothetical protein
MLHTRTTVWAFASACVAALPLPASGDIQETIDAAFALQEEGGTLADVRGALAPHAGDASADFAIGAVEFLMAGEGMVQEAHRTGFMGPARTMSSMLGGQARFLEWFGNDNPETVTHDDLRAAVGAFVDQLETAERSLSAVEGDFTCVISVPAIRFDVNGDGEATSAESLGSFFAMMPERSTFDREAREWVRSAFVPPDLTIAFDRGDASWLRGYCHVLMAAGEWGLAHDGSELFDRTAHVFFAEADISFDYLPNSTYSLEYMTGGSMRTPAPFDLTDVLVFFGNMRLPVSEPERMESSLGHLRSAVALGKEMWGHYDREQDDDREWIPNPRQTAAFGEVRIDEEMRDAWLVFLDEADDVLAGRKVLRFWRGDGSRGIDVPKVFEEPSEFDLLYWIQGSAAAPYLREGEFTSPGTWAQLERVFNGRVFRFSFWFN